MVLSWETFQHSLSFNSATSISSFTDAPHKRPDLQTVSALPGHPNFVHDPDSLHSAEVIDTQSATTLSDTQNNIEHNSLTDHPTTFANSAKAIHSFVRHSDQTSSLLNESDILYGVELDKSKSSASSDSIQIHTLSDSEFDDSSDDESALADAPDPYVRNTLESLARGPLVAFVQASKGRHD